MKITENVLLNSRFPLRVSMESILGGNVPRCPACNGTGRMNSVGGAAYGSADDAMQCPRCHGFGRIDGPMGGGKRATRGSRVSSRGGSSQGSLGNLIGAVVIFGLLYTAYNWVSENLNSITEALWYYVVLPISALLSTIVAFLLLRFLWRCGRWSVGGLIRQTINLVLLFIAAWFFWVIIFVLIIDLANLFNININIGEYQSQIFMTVVGALSVLTGLLLERSLARRYGKLGLAWDLLRRSKTAIPRQISNFMLPLMQKPRGGWFKVKEWDDPFIRGFLNIQVSLMARRLLPDASEEQRQAMSSQVYLQLWRRSQLMVGGVSPGIISGDDLSKHAEYTVGQAAGIIFFQHYHRFGALDILRDDLQVASDELVKVILSKFKKPDKFHQPRIARKMLVKHMLIPRVEAATAS